MEKEKKPLVLNKINELYKNLGAFTDRLNDKSEFFICNPGDIGLDGCARKNGLDVKGVFKIYVD